MSSEVGISEWVSGTLQLPPQAIKDSEHVAHSTQIYIVGAGQPNALELAIALPTNEASAKLLGGGNGAFVKQLRYINVIDVIYIFCRYCY